MVQSVHTWYNPVLVKATKWQVGPGGRPVAPLRKDARQLRGHERAPRIGCALETVVDLASIFAASVGFRASTAYRECNGFARPEANSQRQPPKVEV